MDENNDQNAQVVPNADDQTVVPGAGVPVTPAEPVEDQDENTGAETPVVPPVGGEEPAEEKPDDDGTQPA